jgi:hypothetical protein
MRSITLVTMQRQCSSTRKLLAWTPAMLHCTGKTPLAGFNDDLDRLFYGSSNCLTDIVCFQSSLGGDMLHKTVTALCAPPPPHLLYVSIPIAHPHICLLH